MAVDRKPSAGECLRLVVRDSGTFDDHERDTIQAAASEFRGIVERRGEVPASMFYSLAYLGLARAGSDDPAEKRSTYDRMLAVWKDADANLPPLSEARQERSRLE